MNVKRALAELINEDDTGLMPAFVMQAIGEFAKEVVKASPEQITKDTRGCVSGRDWLRCAEEILALGIK